MVNSIHSVNYGGKMVTFVELRLLYSQK